MNKDVIYIDVDDDVTAIIGKIKKAKEKIVAVVPPKRTGTIQSAVNLRLLDRMARADKKQLVLITNNQALIALAANAQIPVAKNLQSKPEVAEIAAIAVDDGDDIIDGADLPVGDHAGTIKVKDGTRVASGRSDAIETLDIDNPHDGATPEVMNVAIRSSPVKVGRSKKQKIKIPNFDTFRKRLFLGIGGGALLIVLLVWMFVFAPAATVIVTASATETPVSATIKLGGEKATDFEKGIVSSVSQTEKKDETVAFTATGTGEVGDKATGTITIYNCDGPAFTLPANTIFAAAGKQFMSTSSVTVGPLAGSASTCRLGPGYPGAGTGSVSVVAADIGDSYNLSSRSYSIDGVGGDIYAVGNDMTGGSSKTVTVVSSDDIDRARGQLLGKSTDAEKKSLVAKFTNSEKVIDSSFTVTRSEAVSTPAVNAEAAGGKATLKISTTYTIYAIAKADLEAYLNDSLKSQISDENTQKVYDNGISNVGLSNFLNEGGSMTVAITTIGQIGPKIDETRLKDQVKGKIYGEVQSTLQAIEGIKEVDVKFSYFWVRTVPNDPNKINIQFQVQND